MPYCQWSQFGLDSIAGSSNAYRQPDFRPGGEAALHADEFFQRDVDLVLIVDDAPSDKSNIDIFVLLMDIDNKRLLVGVLGQEDAYE